MVKFSLFDFSLVKADVRCGKQTNKKEKTYMMICRVAAQLKIGTMPSKMSHHLEKVNFQFRVQAVYLLNDGKSYIDGRKTYY